MVEMRFRPAGRNPWALPWQKKRNEKIEEEALKIVKGLQTSEEMKTMTSEQTKLEQWKTTVLNDASLNLEEVRKLADVLENEGDGGIWESLDRKNAEIVAAALYRNGVRVQ